MTKAAERVLDRVVLHLDDGLRQVVDPADVYYLEARDEDTRVRLALSTIPTLPRRIMFERACAAG
ncbi:MAG: hypothetical protein WBO69_06685 [Thermoanaerobaculia bacterium]